MNFERDIYGYLNGSRFSNGLNIKINFSKNKNDLFKIEYLKKTVKNKNIIHMGFVDHLPLIENKIKKNIWLHKILNEMSNKCFGIDINKEGVEFVKNVLGFKHVFHLDIVNDKLPDEIKDHIWDYIILADVIEHINNPIDFLRQLKTIYSNISKEVIITTPNAFRYGNFLLSLKNIECINTDHKYWFTPYTLAKNAYEAGFELIDFILCQHSSIPKRNYLKRYILRNYPLLRDTIILKLNFNV